MKKIKYILILIVSVIFVSCNIYKISNKNTKYNEFNYGNDWVYLLKCDSKIQAKNIKYRYKLANIGQDYFKDNGTYYIELTYYDDIDEMFLNKHYCIPRRLLKNIIITGFFNSNDFNQNFKTN